MDNKYKINVFSEVLTEFLKNGISLVILATVGIVVLLVGNFSSSINFLFYFVIFLIITVFNLVYRLIYLSQIGYELLDKSLVMRGGIISRFERTVPYSRIQHVVVSRTFIQRWFGLSTIAIQDAGGDGSMQSVTWNQRGNSQRIYANLVIPGLLRNDAELLKLEVLKSLIKVKSVNQGGL